jgi:hypothetical protein
MRLFATGIAIAVVLTLAGTRPAAAQQLQQTDAEVASGAAAPAAGASLDPNIDRAFIQPTAMTQPAGSVTYNNYELLLHGVTYGITDDVQATLTVLSPITSDMPFLGAAAIKGRISPLPRLHLAAQATFGVLHAGNALNDSGGTTDTNVVTLGMGGYATACLRDDCASVVNASVNYQYATNYNSAGGAHLVIYGGALVLRATEHVKVLGELTSAAGRDSSQRSFENIDGFLISYGVRFHTGALAADVAFVKPVQTSVSTTDNWALGLPFVSVSYRWN